jgi:hypothetical protein
MYYSMPINMFFIVKNHWEPSFTDNPRTIRVNVNFFFRQLEYGKMEHVGPLVQSLVGLVTEFLHEHCNKEETNGKDPEARHKKLTEVCDQLRLTAAKQPPNKEQLTSKITELGNKFTRIVDSILIQHISVSTNVQYQQLRVLFIVLWYPLYMRLGGTQGKTGHYGEERNIFPLPGIEPRLFGPPSHSLFLY